MLIWFCSLLLLGCAVLVIRQRRLVRQLHQIVEALESGKALLWEGERWFSAPGVMADLQRACNALVASNLRANQAQHDYLQQIEATLGNIREAVFIINQDNYVLMANDVLRQFIGREQPLLGRRLESLIQSSAFLDYVRAVKSGEKRAHVEIELRRGRELFWFEVVGASLPERENRRDSLTLFVLHDITSRKRLETMRTEFVANLSHELRTPVTVIKGFAETLMEDQEELDPAEARRFLAKIRQHAVRLNRLLEDLLTLSRLESSSDLLQLELAPLGSLIREVGESYRDRMKAGQLLRFELEPDLRWVRLDPLRISQVVENLLENVLRHAKGFTEVILRTSNEPEGLRLLVIDNGAGIPAADLPHVFSRFYRVEKGRSRETGGTGLGLAIVKHIIQQHGGKLFAESKPGSGTAIGFTLPWPSDVDQEPSARVQTPTPAS